MMAALSFLPVAQAVQPINVANEGLSKTAQPKNWKANLDSPSKVGTVARGLFCTSANDMPYTKALDQFLAGRIGQAFKEKSRQLGYPRLQGADSAFADNSTSNAADLRVGFVLTAFNNTLCIENKELSGSVQMSLKVELYSAKLQKVIYSHLFEGKFASDSRIKESAFYDGVLNNILDQMFADPAYVDSFRDKAEPLTAPAASLEPIVVKNGAKPKDKVKDNARGLQSGVVTIETGSGSGSGFYVGRDGYLISGQHVVGDNKYVKVRLPGGYTVPGEVVRKDVVRDVALIKTDIEPPVAVHIRQTAAKAGDEVYAIGSPFGAQLSNTVTRGIFSGVRKSEEQLFIQSDVAINPGNSGGPLFDADGGLIAITVAKMKNADGINLFIPINEALEKLGVSLQ
jgi:S1-C subfamily serine protease